MRDINKGTCLNITSFAGGGIIFVMVSPFASLMQDGQVSLSRQTHNLENGGAEPPPATLPLREITKMKEG